MRWPHLYLNCKNLDRPKRTGARVKKRVYELFVVLVNKEER